MPVVGALAAADLVFLAFLGVLLLYATRQLWVPFIIWLLSQIPIIGNWVASQASQLINGAVNWISARVSTTIQVVTDFVLRIETRARAFITATLTAAQVTFNALVHLTTVIIPAAIATAESYTDNLAQRVSALVAAAVHDTLNAVNALAARVAQLVAAAEANALAAVEQLGQRVQLLVQAAVSALLAAIGVQVQGAIDEAHRAAAQVGADAAAATAGVAAADAAAIKAANDLARTLSADARAAAAAGVADAEALARALASSSLAQALAATGVVAVELEAIRELECIKQCAPLGQLGNDLQMLDLGVLLALLMGAATHPKEGARAFHAMLAPGAQAASSELGGLLGR